MLAAGYFSLPVARGFIRLSTVCVTFWDGTDSWARRFFHPSAGSANTGTRHDLEWSLTVGSERWPPFNCDSTQESFYRLRLATSAHVGNNLCSISPHQYRNAKFILGQSRANSRAQFSRWSQNSIRLSVGAQPPKPEGRERVSHPSSLRADHEPVCRGHRSARLILIAS